MPPLISIVVPVYNCEHLLPRCIDSLCAQHYSKFELILINDGSSDRSGDICDAYAARDSRLRVIHQRNAGVSAARNRGLECSRGDFICFVDGDDYVDAGYLDAFFSGLDDATDLVFQGIIEEYSGQVIRREPESRRYDRSAVPDGISDINRWTTFDCFGYVCNKLYRRSIIEQRKLRFRTDCSLSEDRLFALHYLRYARNMSVVHACHYHYHPHPGGLFMRKRSFEESKQVAEWNWEAAMALMEDRPSVRLLTDTRRMYIKTFRGIISDLLQSDRELSFVTSVIGDFLQEYRRWLPLAAPANRMQRIEDWALKFPLRISCPLVRILHRLRQLKHAIASHPRRI